MTTIHDYVRSYLGESKDAKEFAKQFIDKRSKYRNQAKQTDEVSVSGPWKDSMWGPAPAITPSGGGKQSVHPEQGSGGATKRGDGKKKKKKMQKMDPSMLGYTVHANSSRVNAGEIETLDTQ
ncbi:PREDICTED: PERQ amino acid-rich with GYF domain-containing protein 2-like [Priapulus caudatus]|uniref:PERQ amino acid-rich with GYF domain-containing protein 2-like n=1 Tax=Priapulus caudatus TaxID=37621 RepID=A0ABM1DQD7_PRICU|nr:PREDICTED: PERQ amino acid-rich with GYF domain-containing protein 2-like [Priapulus caudatus]